MQLEKGEHSILAYFGSSEKAQQAAGQLQEAGLVSQSENIQVDRISRYGASNDSHYNSPLQNALTLSGITLYSEKEGEEGNSPLLAASESASGIGDPDAGAAGGGAFLVTVVLQEEHVPQAVQILEQYGGKV